MDFRLADWCRNQNASQGQGSGLTLSVSTQHKLLFLLIMLSGVCMLTTDLTASERKGFIVNMKKNINRQYYVLKGKEKVKTKRKENKQKRKEKKKVYEVKYKNVSETKKL